MCPWGKARKVSRQGSQSSRHKAACGRQEPGHHSRAPSPDDAQVYPPHLLHFPYQLTCSSKRQLSQSRVASGTNSGGTSGLLASPKDSCAAGLRARKARGQWEAPGVPL